MRTPERLERLLGDIPEELMEVRMRAGRPIQFICKKGECFGDILDADRLRSVLASLMDYSLYAREQELGQGFFTLDDGCRVGVCGRLMRDRNGRNVMTAIGSVCIRISRAIRGAADGFYESLFDERTHKLRSALIVSEPGMGKTTALRDAARRLSEAGHNVCIADERHELAACVDGVPTMDVGPRTDVMDGCPKHIAVRHMLRACAPQLIVTDEIGDLRDAEALTEAVRCGVSILASAHAGSIEQLMARREIMTDVFSMAVLLGKTPGRVVEIRMI